MATRAATAARASSRRSTNVIDLIAPDLLGEDVSDQARIDGRLLDLDGTPNKGKLGANAILGVSLAAAHAAAASIGLPLYRYLGGVGARTLPVPMLNILNGGKHALDSTDFQEFMVMPVGFDTFSEALRAGAEVFHALRARAPRQGPRDRARATRVASRRPSPSNAAAIETVLKAIERAGYKPGDQVAIALDPATTELLDGEPDADGQLTYRAGQGRPVTQDLRDGRPVGRLGRQVPHRVPRGRPRRGRLAGLEAAHRADRRARCQLVGDDLFVTNPERLRRGLEEGSANAILIKLNQIGTLTETLDAVEPGASATAGARSSAIARARPRTPPSRTSRWPPTRARSRRARRPDRSASPSTTDCCASRRSWATRRSSRVGQRSLRAREVGSR